jgi:hypothetical protein
MAAPNTMSEAIFRQYAVIPALERAGCTNIHCENMRSQRRTDILCIGPPPDNRPAVIEVKCVQRIDDMYRAVGQIMFYSIDFPDHIPILAIQAGALSADMIELLKKRCRIKFMILNYPDLSRMKFSNQAKPATLYKGE